MGPIRNFGPFLLASIEVSAYLGVKNGPHQKVGPIWAPKKGPLLKMWAYRYFWT